jgi:Tfp pilus assembly protein PilX
MSTLLMTLILLLAITLPALALMRGTGSDEQLAAAQVDRQRTFQAAEAGLVEGEIFASTEPTVPGSGCSGGICAVPDGTARYLTAGFWESGAAKTATASFDGIQARYIVEYLTEGSDSVGDCSTSGDVSPDAACDEISKKYRIVARALSPTGAEVVLQSQFMVP